MKRVFGEKHHIKAAFLVILMLILVIGCFGTTERVAERIRIINARQSDRCNPLEPEYRLSHDVFLIQYAREAGGLSGTGTHEMLQRTSALSGELHLKVSAMILILLALMLREISASSFSRRRISFAKQPGFSVISYIHAQDGQK